MGDANPIRTLGDYSRPSHEGYRITIELLEGNNVVPLRSDTIRLMQNECSFHRLQSEDPNQHLKDFLKLVDSLDLDVTNRERKRLPHTEGMERFENANFKQREEINDRMTKMFGLLKELAIADTQEASLKSINWETELNTPNHQKRNTILSYPEEGRNNDRRITLMPLKEVEKKNEAENRTKNKPIKSTEKELTRAEEEAVVEAPSSQPVGYYLKHRINEKLIEGLVENHSGPVYEAIPRKNITKKEDIGGNFEIPCNIGGLKHKNALVDQGSDVNGMPLSTYKKLTDERPTKTDIRLSLASHSYIFNPNRIDL
ncbi:hypothetical protein Tco_1538298 [Tanacetum coccineum]